MHRLLHQRRKQRLRVHHGRGGGYPDRAVRHEGRCGNGQHGGCGRRRQEVSESAEEDELANGSEMIGDETWKREIFRSGEAGKKRDFIAKRSHSETKAEKKDKKQCHKKKGEEREDHGERSHGDDESDEESEGDDDSDSEEGEEEEKRTDRQREQRPQESQVGES